MESDFKPECKLTGTDGNVFAIMGKVSKTLKQAGMEDEANEFSSKAMNCVSYDKVLQLAMNYVDVS